MKISAITYLCKMNFKVEIPRLTLFKAKKVALYGLKKEHAKEFEMLRKYIHQLGKSNPGSLE